MTTEELNEWADDFETFHARFAGLFVRSEPREQAAKYMRGLMAPVPHKNGWQIAQAIGDKTPDPTQRLLYQLKKPKARRGWMSMKYATGTVGIGISLSL